MDSGVFDCRAIGVPERYRKPLQADDFPLPSRLLTSPQISPCCFQLPSVLKCTRPDIPTPENVGIHNGLRGISYPTYANAEVTLSTCSTASQALETADRSSQNSCPVESQWTRLSVGVNRPIAVSGLTQQVCPRNFDPSQMLPCSFIFIFFRVLTLESACPVLWARFRAHRLPGVGHCRTLRFSR